jgi:hypothetical protein
LAVAPSRPHSGVRARTAVLALRYSDGTTIEYHAVDHFNARPDGAENFFSHCHD